MTTSTGTDSDDKQKIANLEAKIKEKNKLVKSLTGHLEQAAEKLDRLHRKGAGKAVAMGGMPKEMVDQQKTLTEDLNRIVQQWEAMQMDSMMGRIEMQVTEIRDLITSGGGFSGGTSIQAVREVTAISIQASGSKESTVDSSLEGAPTPGSYEALKAGLLENNQSQLDVLAPQITLPAKEAPAEVVQHEANSQETTPEIDHEQQDAYVEEQIQGIDPPASIDFENASFDDLKEAIESRETYLEYLIRKLRAAELSPRFLRGWQELEQTGEAVKERLEHLEETLNDNLVRAEIELSLERARLGREAIRLEQLEVQIEKKMKRLDFSVDDVEETTEKDDEPESAKGRNWLNMLGIGKGDE